jgi:hypothetical protein
MGGGLAGTEGAARAQDSATTPGSWSGARPGTFSPASGVLLGQVETEVDSEEGETRHIPSLVSVHSGSRNSSMKEFKLYEVPRMDQGYEATCFHLIGQGTTFCTSRNCTTSHQGATLAPLPGALFVAKTATTAFADPRSSIMFLSPDLVVSWNNTAFTLD